MLAYLVIAAYQSVHHPAPGDAVQGALAAASLLIVWFYGGTDRYTKQDYAAELASDIIINLATFRLEQQIAQNSLAAFRARNANGRIRLEIDRQSDGLQNVAMRIVRFRQEDDSLQQGRIKNGRLSRISYLSKSYVFTPEDIGDLITSMTRTPQDLICYSNLFRLIEAAQPAGLPAAKTDNFRTAISTEPTQGVPST
jgi:hypothetical protein